MPITITCKDLSPLCKDYEYVINDIEQLAELITRLLMGHYHHVNRVITGIAPHYPNVDQPTILRQLEVLELSGKDDKYIEKVHGWLFQMISWIVLAEMYKYDTGFHQHYPHPQVSMHGLDGIAVKMNTDNSINRIIITEDKCTDDARNTVKQQVFPEFESIEKGEKNNAIMQHVEALISEDILFSIQDDILKPEYRQYRISITRQDRHDTNDGRKKLFKDYDIIVAGADVDRRTAATINMGEMRDWMEDLRLLVITKLQNYKI